MEEFPKYLRLYLNVNVFPGTTINLGGISVLVPHSEDSEKFEFS